MMSEVDYKSEFDRIDKDQSGFITHKELMTSLIELGQFRSHKQVQRLVGSFDMDGDGKISWAEFLMVMAAAEPSDGPSEEDLLLVFKHFDADCSGSISIAEVEQGFAFLDGKRRVADPALTRVSDAF
jgi:Ca2+-binding EF-hand superfamily protein